MSFLFLIPTDTHRVVTIVNRYITVQRLPTHFVFGVLRSGVELSGQFRWSLESLDVYYEI